MCLLAAHLQQCQRSLCFHPVSELLLLCFYVASLWLQCFSLRDRRPELGAPSFPCVWSQMLWRSQHIIILPQGFLHEHLPTFDKQSNFVMSWIDFSKSHFGSSYSLSLSLSVSLSLSLSLSIYIYIYMRKLYIYIYIYISENYIYIYICGLKP